MKRETAFKGFYKNLKGYNEQMERVNNGEVHFCQINSEMRGYQMRIKRYANSLVLEHGYEDIHTAKYLAMVKS